MGYDKHNVMYESLNEQKTLHVLKKDDQAKKMLKKKEQLQTYKIESIQERLDKKFEKMDAGKVVVMHQKEEKVEKIFER